MKSKISEKRDMRHRRSLQINRTVAIWAIAFGALASVAFAAPPGLPPIILDAHCDVLLRLHDRHQDIMGGEYRGRAADIPLWREGGMNAIFFSIWVDPRVYRGDGAIKRAWTLIGELNDQATSHSDAMTTCATVAEARRAIANAHLAALIGIEGGIAINDDLSMIAKYRAAGVRYMTLSWRGNLPWAGSANPNMFEPKMGLTDFGRQVVREMNRVGMVVDLSHVSEKTFFDAIEETSHPVFVSHSDCRAIADNPRNITDDMLRALGKNGGVCGVNFYWDFLEKSGRGSDEGGTTVTAETVVDHIDHIVKVAGIDHVGIGTDWEGMHDPPVGLENASKMPHLFEVLRRRGYSDEAMRKIAAENFLRVLEANENPK